MKRPHLIILFCAGMLHGGFAMAETSISVQTRYYPVQGEDLKSLHESMQRNGPGGRFLAQTEWNIQWNYRWLKSGGLCRLTATEVTVDISMLMPEPTQAERFSARLQQSWQRFYDALLRHEQHHRDYGILAAQELDELLSAQGPQPCHGFENELSSLARAVIAKYERLEKDYDRQTNHGINEGVVLQ